jgi:hypothetical protein
MIEQDDALARSPLSYFSLVIRMRLSAHRDSLRLTRIQWTVAHSLSLLGMLEMNRWLKDLWAVDINLTRIGLLDVRFDRMSRTLCIERRCEQTCALAAYYNPTSKLATSRLASVYLCVNMSLALIEGVMIAMRRTGQEAFLMFFEMMSLPIRWERCVNNNNNINDDDMIC